MPFKLGNRHILDRQIKRPESFDIPVDGIPVFLNDLRIVLQNSTPIMQ